MVICIDNDDIMSECFKMANENDDNILIALSSRSLIDSMLRIKYYRQAVQKLYEQKKNLIK